jgi:hypothetical protein
LRASHTWSRLAVGVRDQPTTPVGQQPPAGNGPPTGSGADKTPPTANFGRFATGKLKVTKTGKQKLVLKFTKKVKTAFRKREKMTMSLVLSVKDATGNTTRKTARVRLRR